MTKRRNEHAHMKEGRSLPFFSLHRLLKGSEGKRFLDDKYHPIRDRRWPDYFLFPRSEILILQLTKSRICNRINQCRNQWRLWLLLVVALWVKIVRNRRIQFTEINLFPMSSGASEWASEQSNERRGARKRSEQCEAREWVSGVSERASGRFHSHSIQCGSVLSFVLWEPLRATDGYNCQDMLAISISRLKELGCLVVSGQIANFYKHFIYMPDYV